MEGCPPHTHTRTRYHPPAVEERVSVAEDRGDGRGTADGGSEPSRSKRPAEWPITAGIQKLAPGLTLLTSSPPPPTPTIPIVLPRTGCHVCRVSDLVIPLRLRLPAPAPPFVCVVFAARFSMQLKYQKVKLLGEGAYGKAILVRKKADNKKYVVKEINVIKMVPKERREVSPNPEPLN